MILLRFFLWRIVVRSVFCRCESVWDFFEQFFGFCCGICNLRGIDRFRRLRDFAVGFSVFCDTLLQVLGLKQFMISRSLFEFAAQFLQFVSRMFDRGTIGI